MPIVGGLTHPREYTGSVENGQAAAGRGGDRTLDRMSAASVKCRVARLLAPFAISAAERGPLWPRRRMSEAVDRIISLSLSLCKVKAISRRV